MNLCIIGIMYFFRRYWSSVNCKNCEWNRGSSSWCSWYVYWPLLIRNIL